MSWAVICQPPVGDTPFSLGDVLEVDGYGNEIGGTRKIQGGVQVEFWPNEAFARSRGEKAIATGGITPGDM